MDRCISFSLIILLISVTIVFGDNLYDVNSELDRLPEEQKQEIIDQFDDLVSQDTQRISLVENKTAEHTENDTSNVPSHRWPCKPFNITTNSTSNALIINNETEYSQIFAKMNSTQGCGLLLFYSPHCEFCTTLAPLYNAVGRSYPDLAVMAVNVQETMRMAAGYGVVGIPTIFFFYSGRPVSKFNQSRTTDSFQKFIQDLAGFSPVTGTLNITDVDMEGPVHTKVIASTDYYLIFSVVFLISWLIIRFFGDHFVNIFMYFVSLLSRFKGQFIEFWTRPKQNMDTKEKTE